MHALMGKIFSAIFDTFHFTTFALLTLFGKEKMSKYSAWQKALA
jgi:hypothetical protein